jgi:hypothetical protein
VPWLLTLPVTALAAVLVYRATDQGSVRPVMLGIAAQFGVAAFLGVGGGVLEGAPRHPLWLHVVSAMVFVAPTVTGTGIAGAIAVRRRAAPLTAALGTALVGLLSTPVSGITGLVGACMLGTCL